jgi:hypothetical protein
VFVMGHEHQRGLRLAVQPEQQFDDALAGGRIQVAGGLVGEQHRGIGGEGPGDGHPLLLAAGQLVRVMALAGGEPHFGEDGSGAFPGVFGAVEFHRQHDVLDGRERGHQVERLEHETHPRGPHGGPAVLVQRREFPALEPHAAGTRRVQAGQQRQQRGLAGPRRPDDGHGLSPADGETNIVQNGQSSFRTGNLFAEMLGDERRIRIH